MQGLAENTLAVLGDKTPWSLDVFFCLCMNIGRSGSSVLRSGVYKVTLLCAAMLSSWIF